MPPSRSLYILFSLLALAGTVLGFTSYASDFVDPDFVVNGDFNPLTGGAQDTILDWAQELAAKGPWSVMNKAFAPPHGDKHDYMSWAPYWWPNCSGVGNKTELTQEEVWKTCVYESRDGQFNPDGRMVNDVGAFQDLSDAVLYNSLAWRIRGGETNYFSNKAVSFLVTWFLDESTKMNPNLNYAQMQRGPGGQVGSHTGVLDLKGMAKIASAILIFRKGKCSDWTDAYDTEMVAWSKEYIKWLETAAIALEEGNADNNHGSFYYSQLAALKLIVGDVAGAENVSNTFFKRQYMSQIEASGEQPLEAIRTRSYHYRAYNLAAMITNARLAVYANPKSTVWNKTTSSGATIRTALDFAMTFTADATNETKYAPELYPNVAAVASIYGDTDGKYAAFLKRVFPTYDQEANFFWNQPLAGGRTSKTTLKGNSTNPNSKATGPPDKTGGSLASAGLGGGVVGVVLAVAFMLLSTIM